MVHALKSRARQWWRPRLFVAWFNHRWAYATIYVAAIALAIAEDTRSHYAAIQSWNVSMGFLGVMGLLGIMASWWSWLGHARAGEWAASLERWALIGIALVEFGHAVFIGPYLEIVDAAGLWARAWHTVIVVPLAILAAVSVDRSCRPYH